MHKDRPDPYRLHRLALVAVTDTALQEEACSELEGFSQSELNQFIAFIIAQGLHFFWLDFLRKNPSFPMAKYAMKDLKQQCFKETTCYLAQKKTTLELDKLFAAEGLPYVIIKGAHIREILYPNPACRPSVDIDILISPEEKNRAVSILCASGYTLKPDPVNISHEVSLAKENVHLDLHWHILRPGRTRIEWTDFFLQYRQRCVYFWGLDQESTLFIMLTHPVFNKYSTAPHSLLVRLIDLQRWIETQEIDWDRLLELLRKAGMQTAAWITSTYLAKLTGCQPPSSFLESIQPSPFKQFLLARWLHLNLSSKFTNYPFMAKYIFTLLAHDKLTDILRFIGIFLKERRKRISVLDNLVQASRRASL
jgi:hypothetical protein